MTDPANEAPRRRRLRWALGITAAGIAAVAVTWWVRERPPAAVPRAAPTAPTPPPGPPLFAHWVRHESFDEPLRSAMASHYVDTLLGHQVFRIAPAGLPPMLARALLLDDDGLLFSSGRRLWNRELVYQPGLTGTFCFIHSSFCLRRLFDTSFSIDGVPQVIYDNQYIIERFPSHTTVAYQLSGVVIDEHRFITYDDRAVAAYRFRSSDGGAHEITLEIIAPHPPLPQGEGVHGFPLLGRGRFQGVPIFVYLDAPGWTRLPGERIHLQRRLTVPADGSSVHAAIAYRFDDSERESPVTPLGDAPLAAHIRQYNHWFADNVPYFDAPDPDFKKMWYYRWWIVRFHLTEPGTSDLQDFAFYEGKLGFDNLIGFAVPVQLKELAYLRDPRYGVSQVENSYRNRSREGAVLDAPGSPYWGETYSHWIAQALAEFHRVHPLPAETLRALLPAMAADVRAWLGAYDGDGDALPERQRPRVTGYDLDILSWWYFNGTRVDPNAEPPALERVDFASFVFANAAAVSELAEEAGDAALAAEFAAIAARVRSATLTHLWDDRTGFFYPRRADTHERIPIRELHGFFPFTTLLAPNEPRYVAALRLFVDPQEFWARYPPVISSMYHYRQWTWEMDGLTRNIAPHPISMGARTLLQALKYYDQTAVSADHFMELMGRYNDLVYPRVHPNDPTWRPNVHEYYSQWEPYRLSSRPKPSDISHDFHSMYCSLIVEGAVGLTPRRDGKIELAPLAQRWDYFLLDRLRYRGHDLTVVWDRPGGSRRYPHYPEGFSLAIDGRVVFTRSTLDRVVYDPVSDTTEDSR